MKAEVRAWLYTIVEPATLSHSLSFLICITLYTQENQDLDD